jgi:hypothetical protein
MQLYAKNLAKYTIIFLFGLLLILLSISCEDNSLNREKVVPSLFLPESNEIAGWERSYQIGHAVEAENEEQLGELLKSDDRQKLLKEILLSFDFKRGIKQVYEGKIKSATETIEIRIFDLKFAKQAQGYFYHKDIKPAKYDYLDNLGDEARITLISAESNVQIDFYYDKWYAWIYIRGRWSASDAQNIAFIFGEKIFQKMLEYYPVNS